MTCVTLESTDFLSSNSYAKVARHHALFLEQQGFRVAIRSRHPSPYCAVDESLARRLRQMEHRPAAGLRIRYDAPSGMRHEVGGVCMTPFETANLRPEWIVQARALRKLFVHCDTSRQLFLDAGLPEDHVTTVHHGYDPTIYHPDAPPLYPRREFTFLYVGHFNARKCTKMLVRAFCREFRPSEVVRLLLVVQPMPGASNVERQIASITRDQPHAEIEVIVNPFNGGVAERQMGSLYRSGDCLVYPSMGEGFGLPALEAKACGLEVITTRCGGMLDFLDDDSVHWIDVAGVRPAPECNSIDSQYAGLSFWIPDEDSLRRRMREVFEGACKPEMPVGWTWEERLAKLPDELAELADEAILTKAG